MDTQIKVWSANGHTPITQRGGFYCDVLVDVVVQCESPEQAKAEVQRLIQGTRHAHSGHFYMPDFWNHNQRSEFVTI